MSGGVGESAAVDRRAEIAAALARLDQRIAAACTAAGRDRAEVTTIVVTKTHPAADVATLLDLGVGHVGENRVEEAAAKVADLGELAARLTWHQVGQVQTKKAGAVARWADVVHSLDRVKVIDALDRAAGTRGRRLAGLIQVSLDGDPDRGGALLEQVLALAERVVAAAHLDLRGVMAVAPLGADPGEAFARLAAASEQLRRVHPDATMISAGMSGDLEQAIAHGATHLRVGTAVLGSRRLRQ